MRYPLQNLPELVGIEERGKILPKWGCRNNWHANCLPSQLYSYLVCDTTFTSLRASLGIGYIKRINYALARVMLLLK